MQRETKMSSSTVAWKTMPLASLVDERRGISYGIVQPGRPVPSGIPVLRVNNLSEGRIRTDEVLKVSSEVEGIHARTRLRGGEVLLSVVGSIGQSAVVPMQLAGWNVARAIAVIPVRSDVGARWVEYCLRSSSVQQHIQNWATTTVQATLNLRDVAKLPIPLPNERERERIVDILSSLDDKIELNRRMNQTLEELARALFHSWFVAFDPVRAKAAGRQPAGMDAATTALFPAAFEATEHGEIPAEWKDQSLDQVATFLNGLALQRFPPADGGQNLPIIKIAQLKKGNTEGADEASSDLPAQYVVQDGDVLFSWSGSLEVALWGGGIGALNQHLFKVTSHRYPKWFYYLWIEQHLAEFQTIAAGKATTMGHIQRRHLSDARVIVPPPDLMGKMDAIMRPLLERIIATKLESRTLASLRDSLLPELLGGRIDARALSGVGGDSE